MKSISILGCGWLGFPIAKELIMKGNLVKGSTTSSSKLSVLRQEKIHPFLIQLQEDKILGEVVAFLEKSSVLIIDIPPKLRGNASENFVQKIKNLIPFIEKSSIKNVIFISSTSVYNDDNKIVTEADTSLPETESGKQLLETEKLLCSSTHFQTTILRFGGLIGNDRNPIHYLSGKSQIENPFAPINFIHQDDCIAVIIKIISMDVWGEIFNAVAPFHPNRKTYYIEKAMKLGLDLPNFNESKPSLGKTVSSDKLIRLLNYDFKKLE